MAKTFVLGLFLLAASLPAAANDSPAVPHVVRAAETVHSLAERYHVRDGEIQRANPQTGSLLPLGSTILIPPPERGWPSHQVAAGQTLWAISRLYGIPLDELQAANPTLTEKLEIGQQIAVPGGGQQPAVPVGGQQPAVPVGGQQNAVLHGGPHPVEESQPFHAPAPRPTTVPTPAPLPAWVQVHLPDGRVAWVPSQYLLMPAASPLSADGVLEIARKLQGVPYVWGGETPNGVDCSGFVEQVFYLTGHHLPRLADQQFAATAEVAGDNMRPGDLVFFSTYEPGPSHVGIYVGERRFLHASSSHGVTESSLDDTYYAQRFLGARRLLEWVASP